MWLDIINNWHLFYFCKQIPISDARQAESLIAQAMLKRATGMTNANSQSRCVTVIDELKCSLFHPFFYIVSYIV